MATTPWELAQWARARAEDSSDTDAPLFAEAAEQLECLSHIHAELDGVECDSGTLGAVASHLNWIGLTIAEPSEEDEEE